jgi:hypothetical protein
MFVAVTSIAGCEHGSNIPIDPPPEECVDSYDQGFRDGVDSVECECEQDWTDICNEDVPKGHLRKECRGKPEKAAQKCDRNCDPNDPICIPCDLELAERCFTTCVPTGNGGQICRTECFPYGSVA